MEITHIHRQEVELFPKLF